MNKFAIRLGYRGIIQDSPVNDFDDASIASARHEMALRCRTIYHDEAIEAKDILVYDRIRPNPPSALDRIAAALEAQNKIQENWIAELKAITENNERRKDEIRKAELEAVIAQRYYWETQCKILKGEPV